MHFCPQHVCDKRYLPCAYKADTLTRTVDGGGYGQNIAAGIEAANISYIISDLFYNSEAPAFKDLYGQAQPSYANFGAWGHFSQIIWKGTTRIGCATTSCINGLKGVGANVPKHFTVCNYKSPGNYGGQYAQNISRPLGKPTAHWDAWMST
ncbi:uncharacterized protein RCC_00266 [Ramularia collo-cygni]|uniref:SCP domain-containing protein n=1 Tax=Ramularia collo-cygni TaxID=112498 RepID=A0A2D3UQ99_9PEZI|nr:uncharacterized protein RCC_00266 [Ramularia collo-cygni]CZT14290.1 uncharacterized protein RCC_00266 [Ramularia collo-cygni]